MSGVIYGAIVVMWLAFLVPMWLKRHESAPEPKPVERATIAMRVLARRRRAVDTADSTLSPTFVASADESDSLYVSGASSAGGTRMTAAFARLRRGRRDHDEVVDGQPAVAAVRRPMSAAARRRRILGTLLAVTLLIVVIAALGRAPWLAVVPAAALLAAYVALLVAHGRRAARPERVEYAAPVEHLGAEHTVGHVDRTVVAHHAEDPTATFVAAPPAAGDVADDLLAPVPAAAPDGFAGPRLGWDPVPVPSPTYVHAPRAPRAVRSIDLSAGGAWTSGRLVADAKAAAAAAVARSSERQDDSELAQRAVGD